MIPGAAAPAVMEDALFSTASRGGAHRPVEQSGTSDVHANAVMLESVCAAGVCAFGRDAGDHIARML